MVLEVILQFFLRLLASLFLGFPRHFSLFATYIHRNVNPSQLIFGSRTSWEFEHASKLWTKCKLSYKTMQKKSATVLKTDQKYDRWIANKSNGCTQFSFVATTETIQQNIFKISL